MASLIAFVISFQSLTGPCCFLHEQDLVSDRVLEQLEFSLFVPRLVASEMADPFSRQVYAYNKTYRNLRPNLRRQLPDHVVLRQLPVILGNRKSRRMGGGM